MISLLLHACVVAAFVCAATAQSTLGPCICKCAPTQTNAGAAVGCVDNINPQLQQDCQSSCTQFSSSCAQYAGTTIWGVAAAAGATDVTCAGGASSAFPFSLNIFPFTAPPAAQCVAPAASALVLPATVGSPGFSLGQCVPLTIGTNSWSVRLLGVSLSKNYIFFVYSSPNCGISTFVASIGRAARGDCAQGLVGPSMTPDSIIGTQVYFAATVPGQTSSTNIACTCKCASQNVIYGKILGCTDVPASQCGGLYCASMYPNQCPPSTFYLASTPPDAVAAQGIPCAGANGYTITSRYYRPGTFCYGNSVSSGATQVGQSTTWSGNECVSSFGTGYSQRFLGCSSSNYYLFQTFLGSGCQSNQFVSVQGAQAGCTFGLAPFGYTGVFTCNSPAAQLAAGIVAAIVIGSIVVIAGGLFVARWIRRRNMVMLAYTRG